MATKKTKKPTDDSPQKVVGGPARISYAHVFKPASVHPDKPDTLKYSCILLIAKKEKALFSELKKAQQAAVEKGIETTKAWKGKKPSNLTLCIKDGDDFEDRPEYEGHWVISAKSDRKPTVVDREKQPLTTDDEFYSGCYARFSIKFYPYGTAGNNGVSAQLNHLQKIKDGERFGANRASADEDFEEDWEDSEEDEDDDIMGD